MILIRIRKKDLVWDDWNIKHIKKHNVTKDEVEESFENLVVYRKGYKKRLMLIGRSGGRILSVVVAKDNLGSYYVVTARDADKKERRLVYEKENKQNS